MLTIEHCVRKQPYPIAKDKHTRIMIELKVEHNMAMTIKKVINIGMLLNIFLRITP